MAGLSDAVVPVLLRLLYLSINNFTSRIINFFYCTELSLRENLFEINKGNPLYIPCSSPSNSQQFFNKKQVRKL